jgi:hypothetical protein
MQEEVTFVPSLLSPNAYLIELIMATAWFLSASPEGDSERKSKKQPGFVTFLYLGLSLCRPTQTSAFHACSINANKTYQKQSIHFKQESLHIAHQQTNKI